jgi:hypothetical protein
LVSRLLLISRMRTFFNISSVVNMKILQTSLLVGLLQLNLYYQMKYTSSVE